MVETPVVWLNVKNKRVCYINTVKSNIKELNGMSIRREEDDEELTETELKEIEAAEKQIAQEEYVTLDELLKKYGDDLDVHCPMTRITYQM